MARRRPARILTAVMAVVGVTIAGWWFTGTPYWALYRLQRSMVERDTTTFRQFVDSEAIAHNAVNGLMDDASALVWGHPTADDVWRGVGRRLTDETLEALRPQLQRLAVAAVEVHLQRRWLALTDTARNVPHVDLVSVDWQGAVAKATVRLSGAEAPVTFTMMDEGGGRWRIVTLDKAFMKQLIQRAREAGPGGE
jgi:hypothetical protein